MAGQKELWTFWYGDEPAVLQDIKASAMFGKSLFETHNAVADQFLVVFCQLSTLVDHCS